MSSKPRVSRVMSPVSDGDDLDVDTIGEASRVQTFDVETKNDEFQTDGAWKNPLASSLASTEDTLRTVEAKETESELRNIFESIDADGSGFLDRTELLNASLQLGRRLSDNDVDIAMKEMDTDGSGEIDFQEFLGWWRKQQVSMSLLPESMETEDQEVKPNMKSWHIKIDDQNEIEQQREEELAAQQLFLQKMTESRMISPISSFRRKWDAVQAVLLIYIAVVVPYRIGFNDDTKYKTGPTCNSTCVFFFWLDVLIDIYFLVDLGLNFRTAVYSFDGDMIIEPKEVAQLYFKGWFPLDFLACLPVNYIVYIPGIAPDGEQGAESSALRSNKVMRMLRLARLLKILRLLRFKRLLERWEEQLYSKGLFTMAKLLMLIFGLGHWMACAWYYFGSEVELSLLNSDGTVVTGWAYDMYHYQSSNGTREELDTPYSTRYLTSFYWALMTLTTVGYGDISPRTDSEKAFCVIAMVIGGFVFGIIVGSASDVIRRSNPGDSARTKALGRVHGFLHERRIPPGLTRRVRAFYSHYYKTRGTTGDELAIFQLLPDTMRNELALQLNYLDGYAHHGILHKVPFFKGLSSWEITQICAKLTPHRCTRAELTDGVPNRYIMKEGEHGCEMFIVLACGRSERHFLVLVTQGVVAINRGPPETAIEIGKVREGDFFGELAVLLQPPVGNEHGHGVMRKRSAYAFTHSEVMILHAHDLNRLRQESPGMDSVIARAALDTAARNPSLLSLIDSDAPHNGETAPAPLSSVMRWLSLTKRLDEQQTIIQATRDEFREQLGHIEALLKAR